MGSIKGIHDFQDCWRIICALVVVFSHQLALHLLPGQSAVVSRLAHLSVVVFFVISGFSVASSAKRYQSPTKFLAARWSRLISVAFPMVVLALVIDLASGATSKDIYPVWQYSKWYLHVAMSWSFLGEFWPFLYRPFSIIPYWSLAYEFWYYCLFAVWIAPKGFARTACLIAVLFIMGPRIWMLLPCWLLGVFVFQVLAKRETLPFKQRSGYTMLVSSSLFLAFLTIYLSSGIDHKIGLLTTNWCETVEQATPPPFRCSYSQWFLADYPIAIAFAAVMFLLDPKKPLPENWFGKFIRWFAPLTFGVYLAHYTLTLSAVSFLGENPPLIVGLLSGISIVIVATLIGMVFGRTRPFIQRNINRLLDKLLRLNRPLPIR
jgi:peptidoglycan/LPS O-acetylase OafA/YrhL